MKVLITNTVLLNMGYAAIFKGIEKILCRTYNRNVKLSVSDKNPGAASKYYPEYNFIPYPHDVLGSKLPGRFIKYIITGKSREKLERYRFWLGAWAIKNCYDKIAKFILTNAEYRLIYNYSQSDIIISTGGTYLVEKYDLRKRIIDYRLSLYLKKPLIFFTQSIGPFNKPEYQSSFREIFQKSKLILLRDSRSKNHIINLGIDNSKLYVLADAAFALSKHISSESSTDGRLKVGISVRKWNYFKAKKAEKGMKDYLNAIKEVVEYLIREQNAEVTFVSTCQGRPEYHYDDSIVAEAVYDVLPEDVRKSVNLDRLPHSPIEFMKITSQFSFVIATRMHAAILSLRSGTPVLPIAYEFKTEELFRRLDQVQWVTDINTIDASEFVNLTRRYIGKLDDMYSNLMSRVYSEKMRAEDASKLLSELVLPEQKED